MKVLITSDWYKPVINGVVTSVESLTKGLTELGHEVRILTLSGSTHSYRDGNVTYIGSVNVGMIYPNARLRAVPSGKLVRELIEWKPDVVHSQCEFSTFFLARKIADACGCPLVHTYHTVYEDYTHYFSPSVRVGKLLVSAFSRMILSKTDAVIVPTPKIEGMLYGYRVVTPVSVVPSGLELDRFETPLSRAKRNQMRLKLGITDHDKVLVFIGRMAEEKNIEEILKMLADRREDNLKLLLVGDGPYRHVIENKVEELDLHESVVFAGMVAPDQVADYYRLGDIFVSASQSETQGMTYIEAMASGLPLLCRYDECLDGVVDNGKNGFTYQSEREFETDLNTLFDSENYLKEVGEAAKETAFSKYSALGFAEHALDVYRAAIRRMEEKSRNIRKAA